MQGAESSDLPTMWAATQLAAWRLGYQPKLANPGAKSHRAFRSIFLPPYLVVVRYDAYAPEVFVEEACAAASGGRLDHGGIRDVGVADPCGRNRCGLRFGSLCEPLELRALPACLARTA